MSRAIARAVVCPVAALILVAACSAGGGAGGPGATGVGATGSLDRPAPSAEVSLPSSITDPVVADAATRLGVDRSQVRIVLARAETFSDGSLGCPRPGEMYTQAVVEGSHVIVEANGTQLDYRGNERGQVRICENP